MIDLLEANEGKHDVLLKQFRTLVPQMMATLIACVQADEAELAQDCFEVFQELNLADLAVYGAHFTALCEQMMAIAVNKEASERYRTSALQFIQSIIVL